ncbi:MAG: hypothetical protein AVDCRST_MAG48-1256, partial [uncultured Friedmanniella sp.]
RRAAASGLGAVRGHRPPRDRPL